MRGLLYRNRSQTWNLDRAKAPGLDDRKSVHISNIDRLTIVQPRSFRTGPNPSLRPATVYYFPTLSTLSTHPKRSQNTFLHLSPAAKNIMSGCV